MENETLFFKIFKLYKMEYQLLITVWRGLFLMALCVFKHMNKLSVKDYLTEKFEKLFYDASAEPFRGK